jgi:hypothetical protein
MDFETTMLLLLGMWGGGAATLRRSWILFQQNIYVEREHLIKL